VKLEDAVRRCGVEMDKIPDAAREQKNAAAYLELHIEQGPVLERMNLPLGVVLGTKGVERHTITFLGQEAHSGSTPMNARVTLWLPPPSWHSKSAPSQRNTKTPSVRSAA